mgnify:CR=1 FL=1|tara:strand:+ start:8089 stop:8460 length:372 start_codon:yes stop_codon:yes gene_type:complete
MSETAMNSPDKKTIEEQMGELLTSLGEVKTNTELTAALQANAEAIRGLAADCVKTDLFTRAAERYNSLKERIEADLPQNEWLLSSWTHLMDRISESPTRIHVIGSVILVMPLVSSYVTYLEQP